MNRDFKVGDIVQVSGSPEWWTVESVQPEWITCFRECKNDKRLRREFDPEMLVKVERKIMTNDLALLARSGLTKEVKRLLHAGADVNQFGGPLASYTPLHGAVMSGDEELVKLLLNKGANVNARRRETGDTPLYTLADNAGRDELKDRDTVRSIGYWLIAKGAAVNLANDAQDTPLHRAVAARDFGLTHLLLDNGADVNASQRGIRPLHIATMNGDDSLVDKLLEHGADINAKYRGKTPLRIARGFLARHLPDDYSLADWERQRAFERTAESLRTHGGRMGFPWFW